MKQYKHKTMPWLLNHFKNDSENWYQIVNAKTGDVVCDTIPAHAFPIGGNWEPIPETPQMEIVEGVLSQINSVDYTFHKSINKNSIVIANPTDLMKQVVKQIEKGVANEYYINTEGEITLDCKEYMNNHFLHLHFTNNKDNKHSKKIIIIPMEDER